MNNINNVNTSQYIGEPAIINGDLVKHGGDYDRVVALNNEIIILVGTNANYWGNLIEPQSSQIPGGLETLKGRAITSNFLKEHSALIESLLNTMLVNGNATSIKAETFNKKSDYITWSVLITLKDSQKYYFSSETNSGKFVI